MKTLCEAGCPRAARYRSGASQPAFTGRAARAQGVWLSARTNTRPACQTDEAGATPASAVQPGAAAVTGGPADRGIGQAEDRDDDAKRHEFAGRCSSRCSRRMVEIMALPGGGTSGVWVEGKGAPHPPRASHGPPDFSTSNPQKRQPRQDVGVSKRQARACGTATQGPAKR